MNYKIILLFLSAYYVRCDLLKKISPKSSVSQKNVPQQKSVKITTVPTEEPEVVTVPDSKPKPIVIPQKTEENKLIVIPSETLQNWAKDLSDRFYELEKQVVRREVLLKDFSDAKFVPRNDAAILETMSSTLEDLLQRRAKAAENIARRAEALHDNAPPVPDKYRFVTSHEISCYKQLPPLDQIFQHLDKLKKDDIPEPRQWNLTYPMDCADLIRHDVEDHTHFGLDIPVDFSESSVQVAGEVFACAQDVLKPIAWSETLITTFKKNYIEDVSIDFQYFCSAKGFLRHYPAAVWSSMFKLSVNEEEDEDGVADVYDCRLRPWYVAASGAPRDVVILLDGSGSMVNSSNQINAQFFTQALLNALTDDDQVNIMKFNQTPKSLIKCFEEKLVPANHVNTASMLSVMIQTKQDVHNITNHTNALAFAVKMLREQQDATDRPTSCQQAIVLITDSIELNHTQLMMEMDPSGTIRLFVIWLHDPHGLRDKTRVNADSLGCTRDGYYAEMQSANDVTEQVMHILRVMERPLVKQRKDRLRVFSDVYAHIEDPRRSEYFWKMKEDEEQVWRYQQLRKNKDALLSPETRYKYFQRQELLNQHGHYYEGLDVNYRYMISVSIPVFESTLEENITIVLNEERARNSTRTYPVNRLLGVAGVDIPVDRLKLLFPYYQLGAGGSLFLVDHKGNIVLHDNLKPTFDGNVLKPGYRTVDILDVEQAGQDHLPREYPAEWLAFRDALVLEQPKGNATLVAKFISEDGMRASIEEREYRWKRVMDHYTAVVVLPVRYNKRHHLPEAAFTQELAKLAIEAASSEFSVQPSWLYCSHIDPNFNEPEFEVRHFLKRRQNEANFQMKNLKHSFSPIKLVSLFEKPYQCNEALMTWLCKDLISTASWSSEHNVDDHDLNQDFGSVTAFFASDSGLTRWHSYRTSTEMAVPPSGSIWPLGPKEVWYKRAVTSPDLMVVHAPVAPLRKMRRSSDSPPDLGTRYEWLTVARTISHGDRGTVGVAGYHFYPKHLEKLLTSITDTQADADCKVAGIDDCPRCDGTDWSCLLIDDAGWIVAGRERDPDTLTEDDPPREHLSRTHPAVMSAMLSAGLFKLHWIHDYQAVCFTPKTDAAARMPSILRSLFETVFALFRITQEIVTVITVLNTGGQVTADTAKDIEKKRKKMKKDMEREKYESLYDDAVLVNRTEFATCDRSRPFYEFQKHRVKLLSRPFEQCKWPLVGGVVPRTNLILLAVYNHCKHTGTIVPDPFVNKLVDMTNHGQWAKELPATQLACWRNRVPLFGRPPSAKCYPHVYSQEVEYRQCGPWLPDPEPLEDRGSQIKTPKPILYITLIVVLIKCILS